MLIRQLKPREKKCPQGPSREGVCTSLVSTAAGSSLHEGEVGTEAERPHRAARIGQGFRGGPHSGDAKQQQLYTNQVLGL